MRNLADTFTYLSKTVTFKLMVQKIYGQKKHRRDKHGSKIAQIFFHSLPLFMQVFVVVHNQRAPDCHSSASQVARAPVATATYTLVHHRASLNIMTIDCICMTAL